MIVLAPRSRTIIARSSGGRAGPPGTGGTFADLGGDAEDNASLVAYVAAQVGAAVTGALNTQGTQNCAANPNYPAASKGDAYIVSVAGKIGGASGKAVDMGDIFFATADNGGGTEASVGTDWAVIEGNVLGASGAETSAAADATKRVSPFSLGQSIFGYKTIEVLLSDPAGSAVTTGDGKAFVRITSDLNGMDLIGCGAVLDTAGTGGGYLMQLRRKRSGSDVDMLSTRISIDSGENDSADATAAPVIDNTKDDVATGDRIYFDRDGVPTGGKGDVVWMQFRTP